MTKKELKEILQKTWDNMPEEAMGTIRLCVASYLHSFIQAIDTNPEDSKQAEDESKPEPIYAPDDMDEYPAFGKEQEPIPHMTCKGYEDEINKWRTAARKLAKDCIVHWNNPYLRNKTLLAGGAGLTVEELFGDDK